jgi:glycosyltransferase involved in cell wall biosynthesis
MRSFDTHPDKTVAYKIAFIDTSDWDYDISSPYEKPFGGSQSALCYLAEALAKHRFEIYLLNNTSNPRSIRDVHCFNISEIPEDVIADLDVAIVLNQAELGFRLRSQLSEKTAIILWNQHDVNQPAMQAMHDPHVQNIYAGIAFVSHWQREQYYQYFNLDRTKTIVLKNAIAPTFANTVASLSSASSILAIKAEHPILFYTSTPFRGLDLLIDVFPAIRQACPAAQLKIFSSMKVYQRQEESEFFDQLYTRCQAAEGVEYIGSLPQPELAEVLKKATLLSYPNTFPETSCIAVMEAMASGCHVITSELGALPETTAGFADLISPADEFSTEEAKTAYKQKFTERVITFLQQWQSQRIANPQKLEQQLRRQLNFVCEHYTWAARAQEWQAWLAQLIHSHQEQLAIELQERQNQIEAYEQAILAYPQESSNYIYLILELLLQNREEEAHMVWFSAVAEINAEDEQQLLQTLIMHLAQAELEQRQKGNLKMAELLHSYVESETMGHE